MVDNALDSVKWLADLGVKFDQTDVTMPVGALWRRGHKPVEPMGYAFIHVLGDWVTEYGATILTETRAENLLMENSRVVGVVAHKTDGTKVTVRAKSVFLTAGGFGANTPMVQKYNTYWKHIDDDIATTNSPAITGDGISLGQEAGAELTGMGFIQLMPVSDPVTGNCLPACRRHRKTSSWLTKRASGSSMSLRNVTPWPPQRLPRGPLLLDCR